MNESVNCEEYARFVICREFNMDFYTYENQPTRFIEEIMIFLKQELERDKKQTSDIKPQSGYKLAR